LARWRNNLGLRVRDPLLRAGRLAAQAQPHRRRRQYNPSILERLAVLDRAKECGFSLAKRAGSFMDSAKVFRRPTLAGAGAAKSWRNWRSWSARSRRPRNCCKFRAPAAIWPSAAAAFWPNILEGAGLLVADRFQRIDAAARRAGIQQARAETATSTEAEIANATGSCGLTWNSMVDT